MRVSVHHSSRRHQDGSAVVVVIILLAIMLVYIGANIKTLHYMGRELKLIEKRQVQRLATQPMPTAAGDTNQPAPVPVSEPTNSPAPPR